LDQEAAADPVRQRRRLMPTESGEPVESVEPAAVPEPEPVPATVAIAPDYVPDARLVQLRASMTAAREESAARQRQLLELQAELQVLRGGTLKRRRERAEHVERLRAAAALRGEPSD